YTYSIAGLLTAAAAFELVVADDEALARIGNRRRCQQGPERSRDPFVNLVLCVGVAGGGAPQQLINLFTVHGLALRCGVYARTIVVRAHQVCAFVALHQTGERGAKGGWLRGSNGASSRLRSASGNLADWSSARTGGRTVP